MVDKGPTTKPRFTTSDGAGSSADPDPAGADAVKRLAEHFAELREYASHLAAAKADRFKLRIRGLMAAAVLGMVGLLIAFAVTLISVWLVLTGISGGLGELLEDRQWLANLITGGVFLVFLIVSMLVGLGRWKAASQRATTEKYEQRKRIQQSKFGRDVDHATSAGGRN